MLTIRSAPITVRSGEFVSLQISYSTADVERSVFYSPEYELPLSAPPFYDTKLIVVNGELCVLDTEASPDASVPLSRSAGIFAFIDDTDEE